MRPCFWVYLLSRGRLYCSPDGLSLFHWLCAARGMKSDVPSWSELRVRHAAQISKIGSEISSSRRETNRLRRQNVLRRQQLQLFDRAFVVLRRKLRAQTWQPLPPLAPTLPTSSEKA